MSAPPKSRKRAVRLTPDAHGALLGALHARWERDASGKRLTWEVRTRLLGVDSVATARRVVANEGVDRSTLALAFKSLDLAWDDGRCESCAGEPEAPAPKEPKEPEPPKPLYAPTPKPRRWPLVAGGLLVVLLLAAWPGRPEPRQDWQAEFDRAMAQGIDRYAKGDYAVSGQRIERANAIAKAHDSADRMAYAHHLLGDLDKARGHLRAAKVHYLDEEALRRSRVPGAEMPDLDEALGDVQTRLGEYDEARTRLLRSLEGYRNLSSAEGVLSAQRDLGSVELGAGNLDLADAWLRRSLEGLRKLPNPGIEADVHSRQALVLLARRRPKEAAKLLEGCLAFWRAQGHPRWTALTEMQLGQAEAALRQTARAADRLARSRDAFVRVGDEARVAEATTHLALLGRG